MLESKTMTLLSGFFSSEQSKVKCVRSLTSTMFYSSGTLMIQCWDSASSPRNRFPGQIPDIQGPQSSMKGFTGFRGFSIAAGTSSKQSIAASFWGKTKSQWISKVLRVHHLGSINVCIIHDFEMFHWITENNVLLLVVTSNIYGLIYNSAEKERGQRDWNTVVWEGSPFLPSPGQYNTSSQQQQSPVHSNGSGWWVAGGPGPDPHPWCSCLFQHTPRAGERVYRGGEREGRG